MNSQRIFTKTFFLGALSLFALTFVPGFASSEPATAQQSPFSALGSPRLQATSGELNRQLMPSPISSVPLHPERSESPTHTRLAELTEDDGEGEGISDGGGVTRAPEAGTPKEDRDYGGPLGGLGISCEDQKDLEALAFGTYGNILKALVGNPSIVKCAPQSSGTDESDAPSSRSGTSDGKGERK